MPEWQQRVVDELSELQSKLDKLTAFLDTPVEVISGSAGERHYILLVRQREEMAAYAGTLKARVELFPELA